MTARGRAEEHRASTPLEFLFDLCFVVAVSGPADSWCTRSPWDAWATA
jgi:low temperature requirement protein LtrA